MHWKQVNIDDYPDDLVLAKNKDGEMLVGILYLEVFTMTCEGRAGAEIRNVTHFILVSDLAKLHNELRP